MKRYAGDIDIFNIPKKPIKDKEPLTNGLDNRFRTDILINGKTNFEKDNNIINSMSDEIISLKEKLSFVYQKDSEIQKLKCDIESLTKENKELLSAKHSYNKLKMENLSHKDEISSLQVNTNELHSLRNENKLLKEKLDEYHKQLHPDDKSIIDDTTLDDTTLDDTTFNPISNKNIHEEIEEMISVDIDKLKFILSNRLKSYHEKHINSLISNYDLENKSEVSKKMMEQILSEAIHI